MSEPRLWGDVYPPDDPRPGDVWLANCVRRVRVDDRWEPPLVNEYILVDDHIEYRKLIKQIISNSKKQYWERQKLNGARVRIVRALRERRPLP
jgi:hypothetical protein